VQGSEIGPGITRAEQRKDGIANLLRFFDVDLVCYVVFVTAILHPEYPFPCEGLFAEWTKRQGNTGVCAVQ
jgi:hypothetical protein